MSADGSVRLKWPDDERKYRLGIGELRELQERLDVGPAQLFKRLSEQEWRFDDVRETVRLGLIGGGETPQKALALVGRYVTPGANMMPAVAAAQAIIMAALVGVEDDPVGKPTPETERINLEGSPSRASTEQEPPSAGRLDKSTNAHSLSS